MSNKRKLQSLLVYHDKNIKDLSSELEISYATLIRKLNKWDEIKLVDIYKIRKIYKLTNEQLIDIFFDYDSEEENNV